MPILTKMDFWNWLRNFRLLLTALFLAETPLITRWSYLMHKDLTFVTSRVNKSFWSTKRRPLNADRRKHAVTALQSDFFIRT